MKWYLLFNNFSPQRKCGAEVIVPSILGGLGLTSNIIGNTRSNSYSSHLQQEENEKNRQFQADEAEKQRKYESYEAQKARQWQSAEWYSQFLQGNEEWYKQQDYSNQQSYNYWLQQQQYNSPAEQAKRLAQAGFNPSAVIGNSTFGSTGLSAAPTSVQQPSTPGTSVPVGAAASGTPTSMPHLQNPLGQFAQFMDSVGSLFKQLNSGHYDSALANKVRSMLSGDLALQSLQIKSQELYNDVQVQTREFNELTMNDRVKQEFQKVALLMAEVKLKGSQATTEDFKQVELQWAALEHQADIALKGKNKEAVEMDIAWRKASWNASIDVIKSQAAENYAIAFNQRAQGLTENMTRNLKKECIELQNQYQRLQNRGLGIDVLIKDETAQAQMKIIFEQAEQAGLITAQEKYNLAQAIYKYDTRQIESFFNWLGKGVGAYRDFGIGKAASSQGPVAPKQEYNYMNSPWSTNTSY